MDKHCVRVPYRNSYSTRMDLFNVYESRSMEPTRSVCPCFGGRTPVVIYDLTQLLA